MVMSVSHLPIENESNVLDTRFQRCRIERLISRPSRSIVSIDESIPSTKTTLMEVQKAIGMPPFSRDQCKDTLKLTL